MYVGYNANKVNKVHARLRNTFSCGLNTFSCGYSQKYSIVYEKLIQVNERVFIVDAVWFMWVEC